MTKFVKYEIDFNGIQVFAKVDDDGLIRYTCTEEDPQYQLWLKSKKTLG